MHSKHDLIVTKMRLEGKLTDKVKELFNHPAEATIYKVLCAEIRSMADDLERVAWELTKLEEAVEKAN